MKILFIQTGGTIDKDYPRITGGYAFEITEPAVKRILEKIKPGFEYEILSLMRKDSQDISMADREKILDACRRAACDRIIVTHGTDTMIETARTLSAITDKTIILTGAMRPERFTDSDAAFNIGVAIGAANTLQPGVYIAMHGRVFSYDRAQRDIATGRFTDTD